MLLERRINVILAMNKNRTKGFVYKKFKVYMREYDAMQDKSLHDKLDHGNLFLDYLRYMAKSEDGK